MMEWLEEEDKEWNVLREIMEEVAGEIENLELQDLHKFLDEKISDIQVIWNPDSTVNDIILTMGKAQLVEISLRHREITVYYKRKVLCYTVKKNKKALSILWDLALEKEGYESVK